MGLPEIGDPYRTLAVRDGIEAIWSRASTWRADVDYSTAAYQRGLDDAARAADAEHLRFNSEAHTAMDNGASEGALVLLSKQEGAKAALAAIRALAQPKETT
jgi:hypothetical protein